MSLFGVLYKQRESLVNKKRYKAQINDFFVTKL